MFTKQRIAMAAQSGQYRISLKFKTLQPSGLLMLLTSNSTFSGDFASLELINGRIRYSFGYGAHFESVFSAPLPSRKRMDDLKWHSVIVQEVQTLPLETAIRHDALSCRQVATEIVEYQAYFLAVQLLR